jgi:hypothetical protein
VTEEAPPTPDPGEDEPLAREGEHVPPEVEASAYHCPYCGVLAPMIWRRPTYDHFHGRGRSLLPGAGPGEKAAGQSYAPVQLARCNVCLNTQIWAQDDGGNYRLVRPVVGGGPRPHVDMPVDVRADYDEARSIVSASPRGACALLRLATQRLVNDHLQTTGGDLNNRIELLVEAGLPEPIEQALDVLRVIGNEAVHPGELDLKDDVETASGLFECLNVIIEDRITRPKRIAEMHAKLPPGKLQGILSRKRPPTDT